MKLSQKKPLRKTSFLALATAWGALLAVLVLPSMALAEIECHGLFPHPPAADNCHAIDFPGPAHNCCMDGAAFECKNDKLYCDECEAPLVCGGNQSWTWCDDEPGVPAVPVCELCPECEPGKVCYKGNCCTPSCEGKECGSDYCGGSCGECEYGGCSSATDFKCPKMGTCESTGSLECGETVNLDLKKDGESQIDVYTCAPIFWGQACAESVVSFTMDETAVVTVWVDEIPEYEDIDLFVLEENCEATACIGYSAGKDWIEKESVKFLAEAGSKYYAVVEQSTWLFGQYCDDLTVLMHLDCIVDCEPDCESKTCGSDGCIGSCGECAVGQCVDGICQAGPGCEVTSGIPGCDGCSCEECVCAIDSKCCWSEWAPFCAAVCTAECGGCPPLADCFDGVCQPGSGENCHTCPQDCGCSDGLVCADGQCCQPDCEGKECGYDGCGGLCGECGPEEACTSGECVLQDGCQDGTHPGCNGCKCEACVCSLFDGYCCAIAWDFACAIVCEEMCEGCGFVDTCGDGLCDGDAGEGCDNCVADCGCEEPETCFGNKCCLPDCEDKECGPTGCGGICGYCYKWGGDKQEACTPMGKCLPIHDWVCSTILECLATCDDWDVECAEYCGDMGTVEEQQKLDSMLSCLMDAGMWQCGNDEECLLSGWAQCEEEVLACTAGAAPCGDLYECATKCPVLDGDCVGMCAWGGSEATFYAFLDLMECLGPLCPMGLPNCDLAESFAECSQQADECLGKCEWECLGRECGEDSCGGICGTGLPETLGCPEAMPVCDLPTSSCLPCVPDCDQKWCGDDGCGGSCGECEANHECAEWVCEPVQVSDVVEQPDLVEGPDVSIVEVVGADQQAGDLPQPETVGGKDELGQSDAAPGDKSADAIATEPVGGGADGGCGGCASAHPKGSPVLPTLWIVLVLGSWLLARSRRSASRNTNY